jgi:hypothetical protein
MPKKPKPKKPRPIAVPQKKLNLPNDEPAHLDMTSEEAIKKAVNTPIKNIKKKN